MWTAVCPLISENKPQRAVLSLVAKRVHKWQRTLPAFSVLHSQCSHCTTHCEYLVEAVNQTESWMTQQICHRISFFSHSHFATRRLDQFTCSVSKPTEFVYAIKMAPKCETRIANIYTYINNNFHSYFECFRQPHDVVLFLSSCVC